MGSRLSHRASRRALPLFVYGEVPPETAARLASHLKECEECREHLRQLTQLGSVLARAEHNLLADGDLLPDAREGLRQSLAGGRSPAPGLAARTARFGSFLSPGFRLAAGAAAALATGFFIGRFFPSPPPWSSLRADTPAPSVRPAGPLRISDVRLLSSPDSTGTVELAYDQLRPVRVSGSIENPEIQTLLAKALLTEDNPGVRLRALDALARQHAVPEDPEIKTALVLALKTDENAAVRRQALSALRRYPADRVIRDALLFALLYDANPGLRVAAVNALDSLRILETMPDPAAIRALFERMHNEENIYVRLRVQAALLEAREQ